MPMQGLARNTPSCAFSVSEASEYEEVPPQSQRQAGVCMCAPQARARVAVRHLPRERRRRAVDSGGGQSFARCGAIGCIAHGVHTARCSAARVAQSSVYMPCAMKPMTETCKRLGHGRAACRRGRLCADQERGLPRPGTLPPARQTVLVPATVWICHHGCGSAWGGRGRVFLFCFTGWQPLGLPILAQSAGSV